MSSVWARLLLFGLATTLAAAAASSGGAPAAAPAAGGSAAGNLTLALVLDSNMVLQRAPKQAKLWGSATPGAAVQVQLDPPSGPTVTATADGAGAWAATLPPQKAGVGHSVLVTTKDGGRRLLTNVAFGDAYFCSGQSHMSFSVNQDMNGTQSIAESAKYPGIRMLTVAQGLTSTTPLDDLRGTQCNRALGGKLPNGCNTSWLVSEPTSFGAGPRKNFSFPSAICYYFARELYQHQQGAVPIGIISSAVGVSLPANCTRLLPTSGSGPSSSLAQASALAVWTGLRDRVLDERRVPKRRELRRHEHYVRLPRGFELDVGGVERAPVSRLDARLLF